MPDQSQERPWTEAQWDTFLDRAQCRRAMAAAKACALSLQCVADRQLLTSEATTRLQQQLTGVRHTLDLRLKELRSRVWW